MTVVSDTVWQGSAWPQHLQLLAWDSQSWMGCCPGATSLEPSASPCQGPEQGSDTQPSQGWSVLLPGRAVRHSEGLGAGHPYKASSLWPTQLQIPEAAPLRVPGRVTRWSPAASAQPCLLKGTLWSLAAGSEAGLCGQMALPERVHRMNGTLCEQGGDTGRPPPSPLSTLPGERDLSGLSDPRRKEMFPQGEASPRPTLGQCLELSPPQASQRYAGGDLGPGTWPGRPLAAGPPSHCGVWFVRASEKPLACQPQEEGASCLAGQVGGSPPQVSTQPLSGSEHWAFQGRACPDAHQSKGSPLSTREKGAQPAPEQEPGWREAGGSREACPLCLGFQLPEGPSLHPRKGRPPVLTLHPAMGHEP